MKSALSRFSTAKQNVSLSIMRRFAMIKLLLEMLRKNPMAGADLGDGIGKVRMAITSKGKGKSGGARVITYTADVITVSCEGELLLLSIYDKSEHSTISDKEIKRLKKLAEAHMTL